jgi:hypothetical protein
MLTKEHIIYSGQTTDRVIMALALGIEGDVLITIPTFVDIYELLLSSTSISCSREKCDVVNLLKDGEIIETLSLNDSFMGSVLASSPDIMEIVRRNLDNSIPELTVEIRTKLSVVPGWSYNEFGFVPPLGWILPPERTPEEIEIARVSMQKLREQ